MKYLSDVEAKIEALRDIRKEIFWLKMAICLNGGGIIGVLIVIAGKIH